MKKFLKVLGLILLLIIVAHVGAFLYLFFSNNAFLGEENERNVSYLKENMQSTSSSEVNEDFFEEVFSDDFYESTVILLGENHGYADIQQIDLELLKHLHQKINLRYYLAEMEPTLGDQLNGYINSSQVDDTQLAEVVEALKSRIPQQASQELFEKWKAVKAYNLQQPDSLRITVIGLDKEADSEEHTLSRDSVMMRNLHAIVERDSLYEQQFYGFFGYFHVCQDKIGANTAPTFASRLKKAEIQNLRKVQSIVSYHVDSEVFFPENPQYPSPESQKLGLLNDDGPITLVKGINDLIAVSKPNSINLFKLNGEDSPYQESQDLAGMKVNLLSESLLPSSDQKVTTDFFQYVLLGRNSKALSPFNQ